MKKRLTIPVAAGVLLVVVIALVVAVVSRQRVERHRVFRIAPAEKTATPPSKVLPVAEWSDAFERLPAADLEELLDAIEKQHPDLYARDSLAYLHARVLLERNDLREAAARLAEYLQPKNPLRDLALYHQSEIEDGRGNHDAASRARQELIDRYPDAFYRHQAIDDEADYLGSLEDPAPLIAFAARAKASSISSQRRELAARIAESQLRAGRTGDAFASAMALLNGETTDDAADRVSRAVDRPDLIARMTPTQRATLGDALRNHRRFDRAIALLTQALAELPAQRDDLLFQIGRSYFGNENYAQAQQTYLRGAGTTADKKQKCTFLFHASRAAQLRGDDAAAERLMTAAIAVPGRFPATMAALTQRIRTRVKQKRFSEAAGDLQLLRKIAPKDHAVADGSLAYALGMLADGNAAAALSTLNSVPLRMLDKYDLPEFGYWRARALEWRDAHGAFVAYLAVLRASVPTHFAYFARERMNSPAMQSRVAQELAVRDAQVKKLEASKQFQAAKTIETDRILLSLRDRTTELERLASIYREIPQYRNVLELRPDALPHFPDADVNDRGALLMALGLYDEASEEARQRYSLRSMRSALTQSVALNRGSASRESIYAVEVLMKSVPADFLPDLLPDTVRRLLYPRYFDSFIQEDSKKYGADPTLVLAIMREESRFNPRAKSQAAARGLLQFIITTARDIGRAVGLVDVSAEDLYDPRVIIQLGAKYVSELSKQFNGDRYMTAGAYNAGPRQVALWSRLAPSPGHDWFLSSVNFDETRDYIRKVMNSYRRYDEIYGNAGPQGGLRVEP